MPSYSHVFSSTLRPDHEKKSQRTCKLSTTNTTISTAITIISMLTIVTILIIAANTLVTIPVSQVPTLQPLSELNPMYGRMPKTWSDAPATP